MKGSVTLDINDFKKLEAEATKGVELWDRAIAADIEISKLLAFFANKVEMHKLAKEFNDRNTEGSSLVYVKDRWQLKRVK